MALFISPSDFAAHVNLGVALYEQGDLGGASRELNRAITLRPDNPLPHDVLGFVLFQTNKLDDALAHWQTAARLNPGSADIAAALAIALWRKGNKPNSLASYNQALSLDHAYVCSAHALRTQGYWNATALAVLQEVRAAAGASACDRGSGSSPS
jgi:Flp pilus assembly protein TadD